MWVAGGAVGPGEVVDLWAHLRLRCLATLLRRPPLSLSLSLRHPAALLPFNCQCTGRLALGRRGCLRIGHLLSWRCPGLATAAAAAARGGGAWWTRLIRVVVATIAMGARIVLAHARCLCLAHRGGEIGRCSDEPQQLAPVPM